jgi:hypothetical protein
MVHRSHGVAFMFCGHVKDNVPISSANTCIGRIKVRDVAQLPPYMGHFA